MNKVKKTAWVNVVVNEKFICVKTYSGYRSSQSDPKGMQFYFSIDVSDDVLGKALIEALTASRFVTPEEDIDLFNYKLLQERYKKWVEMLIDKYKYKSKRALFKNMMSCNVKMRGDIITIEPTYHVKQEAWEETGEDTVTILQGSVPAEIGQALRLVFSRCS